MNSLLCVLQYSWNIREISSKNTYEVEKLFAVVIVQIAKGGRFLFLKNLWKETLWVLCNSIKLPREY